MQVNNESPFVHPINELGESIREINREISNLEDLVIRGYLPGYEVKTTIDALRCAVSGLSDILIDQRRKHYQHVLVVENKL